MRKQLIIVGVRKSTELINHIDKILDLEDYKKKTTITEFLGKILKIK
jgi:hypothetical protein